MKKLILAVSFLIASFSAAAQDATCTKLINARFEVVKKAAIKVLPMPQRHLLEKASWVFVEQKATDTQKASYARVKFGPLIPGDTDVVEISPEVCPLHVVEINAYIAHEFGHLIDEILTPAIYTAEGRGSRQYQDYENIANEISQKVHKAANLDLTAYIELADFRCTKTSLPYWCLQYTYLVR